MIKILIVISLYSFLSSCSPSGDIYDTDDNHDVKDEYSQNGQDNDAEDEDSDSETTDSEEDGNSYDVLVSSVSELNSITGLKPGSIVALKDGIYEDSKVSLRGDGTENEPIVFISETKGGVIFRGKSSMNVYGSHVIIDGFRWENPSPDASGYVFKFEKTSSHCVLRNSSITGTGTEQDAEHDSKWISIYGTGNTVTHCSFEDKRNIGALCVVWLEKGKPAEHVISYNHFTRPMTLRDSKNSPINGQETIRIGDSSTSLQDANCIVEHNYFYHCHGEEGEIISNKSCGNIYRYNGFHESKGTLTLRHGNNCKVHDNYFLGNDISSTGGVRIIGEGHVVESNRMEKLGGDGYKSGLCVVRGEKNNALNGYAPVKSAVVRNNVFIECKLAMHLNYKRSSNQTVAPVGVTISDNTAIAKSSSSYVVKYEKTTIEADIRWSGNTLYGKFDNNIFGCKLETVKPDIPENKYDMDKIRANAGIVD